MATFDVYYTVSTNITSLPVPFTCGIGEIARSTTEDITKEGAAVVSNSTTTFGIVSRGSIERIVGSIFVRCICSLSILPACTFRQRIFIARYIFQMTVSPFFFRITAVKAISNSSCQILTGIIHLYIAVTNLAAVLYGYLCIVLHESLLSTAKDITLHEGFTTNSDICLSS